MQSYLEKITPNVSDAWRADELYLVKGNPKYLYALMDDQTRFWIAQQVADTKYTSNVRPLLENAKEQKSRKRPNTFITDGEPNFHDAFNKEFFTINNPRTRHISHIRLQGDHNNNNKNGAFEW